MRGHSRNGSWVDGVRLGVAELADGSLVRCGNSLLLVRHERIDPDDADVVALAGPSQAMGAVRAAVARAGPARLAVLLQGETGVGKGVAARALHELSARSGRWLQLNCAAIPEHLAESTLFGHDRGAFSGADRAQSGYSVDADGGTLFLDEIGELPPTQRPAPEEGPTRSSAPDRATLEALLRAHRGQITAVAREVGRSTKQFYRWLARHGLDAADYR